MDDFEKIKISQCMQTYIPMGYPRNDSREATTDKIKNCIKVVVKEPYHR